jgi:chloramphenicol O-acetyltransferase
MQGFSHLRVAFQQFLWENDDGKRRKKDAVSIHVHHALMDRFHEGHFVDLFQEEMNTS